MAVQAAQTTDQMRELFAKVREIDGVGKGKIQKLQEKFATAVALLAAAGRRREVLDVAFKSASAPDEPSCPTRSDPCHARVVLELRKSALLNSRRVLRITFPEHSLIVAFGGAVARRLTARPATRASPRRGGTSASTP